MSVEAEFIYISMYIYIYIYIYIYNRSKVTKQECGHGQSFRVILRLSNVGETTSFNFLIKCPTLFIQKYIQFLSHIR